MIAVVVLGIKASAAEIGRGSNGGAAFAALDDGDVEMGAGDWVSPPIGVEKSRPVAADGLGKVYYLEYLVERGNRN